VQSGIHGPCVSSVKQTKKSTPLIPIQHVHRHVWSLGTNSINCSFYVYGTQTAKRMPGASRRPLEPGNETFLVMGTVVAPRHSRPTRSKACRRGATSIAPKTSIQAGYVELCLQQVSRSWRLSVYRASR
jgi:hypothetical protein